MEESKELPPGFRFTPLEEELINLYLKPKVLGQKLPCNIVEERQLYGPDANPWQLFDPENHSWILSEVSPGKFEKITYVFVNLTRKAIAEEQNKSRRDYFNKKAGCGTWYGKTSRTEIRDCNGDLIAERRMLAFEINEVPDEDLSKVGHWRMHEYHLCGVNKDISNPCKTVLCKITLDSSKNPHVNLKLRSKCNHDHPINSSSKPEKKSTNVHITTQTRRDDSVASDSYRVKGIEGCENIETRDGVECVNNCYVEEDIAVTAKSPSEQFRTGYLNPSISDFHWPAKNENDCKRIKIEGGRGEIHSGMTKVQVSRFPTPKEEQPVEDKTTYLEKRKVKVEI